MFEFLFLIILLLFILLASGFVLLNRILFYDIKDFNLSEIGLSGIFFCTFLSFAIHFFAPFNQIITFFVFLIIFIFSLKKSFFSHLIKEFSDQKIIIFFSFILIVVMTINYNVNEDYGYYHLPYITNIISDKIILGLSNLQVNFAWNSSWLNFTSLLNLPPYGIRITQLSNSILFFFITLIFLIEIFKRKENKKNLSFFYLGILSSYIIIKFSRIKEHGFDLPANLFFLFAIYYFIKIFEDKDSIIIEKNFLFILLFSALSVTIKLTTFALPLIILSAIYFLFINKHSLVFIFKPFIIIAILLSMWSIQQILYSGCIIPFLKFTCLTKMTWYDPGISDAVSGATGAVNKSFNEYKGTLQMNEYIKNFNWVPTWFNRNKIEFIEHFIAMFIPLVILIIINLKKIRFNFNNNYFFKKKLLLTTLFFVASLGLVIWFIKSPVIRFGIPYIFLFYFILIIPIYYHLNLSNINYYKTGFKVVIILALIFNLGKNLNRLLKSKNFSYWPILLEVPYDKNKIGEFYVHFPNSTQNYHKLKYCWNIPYICHMGRGENLEIYKKNTYTFIRKK